MARRDAAGSTRSRWRCRIPDATVALLSGAGEVNSHFSVPPYQNVALKSPGIRTVLDSTDVMGGPATITVIFGTVKFHDANPKTMAAILAALGEASDFIARDKRAAAELYLKATKEKISPDELTAMLESPGYMFYAGAERHAQVRRANVQDRRDQDPLDELEGCVFSRGARPAWELTAY